MHEAQDLFRTKGLLIYTSWASLDNRADLFD